MCHGEGFLCSPRIGPTNPPWGLPLVAGAVSCPKLRPGFVEGVLCVEAFSWFPSPRSCEWRFILGCTVKLRVPLWASQLILIQES